MPTVAQQPLKLFANSGIQFIDYTFTPNMLSTPFIRASVQGPLREVEQDSAGHYFYRASDNEAIEWVRPEYSIRLTQSLQFFQHHWLPIPYTSTADGCLNLRPSNWVRAFFTPSPKRHGEWKMTLAIDTAVSQEENPWQPSQFDTEQGQVFSFPLHQAQWQSFSQQPWVESWLQALKPVHSDNRWQSSPTYIWQAHYHNILKVLAQSASPHPLLLQQADQQSSAIAVEIIIDLGNTNCCGVLIEKQAAGKDILSHCSEIQIRDLSCPTNPLSCLISSEMNFSSAPFGDQGYSSLSGRMQAFQWQSLVRIGAEAERLNRGSHHDLQYQGLTSPRRYLWDDHRSPWSWHNAAQNTQAQFSSIDHPFSLLIDDSGTPLEELSNREQLPVFIPQFSRSSLLTFVIIELLCQITSQINSHSYRQRLSCSELPRYLTRINFTLPVSFTELERQQFQRLAQRAIALVREAEQPFFPLCRPIEIAFPWDEASCGQIFWLWQQLRHHSVAELMQRYHHSAQPPTLRVALIDIGGGTTDLAITEYQQIECDETGIKALSPQLLYRAGFTVAGDSVLEEMINVFLLPQLIDHCLQRGLPNASRFLERLFCRGKSQLGDLAWRQYMVRHLFLPVIDDILWRYRLAEDAYFCRVSSLVAPECIDFILDSLAHKIGDLSLNNADLQLRTLCFQFSFAQLDHFLASKECRLTQLLTSISDNVTDYRCDTILLSGQLMELPIFQQPFRLLHTECHLLTDIATHAALPFCSTGRLMNGKHATSVGALLYRLTELQLTDSQPMVAGDISTIAVARWYGPLDNSGRLSCTIIAPPYLARHRTRVTLTAALSIGYRCRAEETIIAAPLFALVPDVQKIPHLALGITVELEWQFDLRGELLQLPQIVAIENSRRQKLDRQSVSIELNTLSFNGDRRDAHWRDDGNIMLPVS